MSHIAGSRVDWIQAGGGNTSIKLDDRQMAVKSSGVHLSDVSETTGYSLIDYPALAHGMRSGAPVDLESATMTPDRRPSIETFMHAILGKVVLHTHPTAVIALASRSDWRDILRQVVPEAILIPYITPGLALGMAILPHAHEQVIILENHGLIVSGNDADTVLAQTESVISRAAAALGIDQRVQATAQALTRLLMPLGMPVVMPLPDIEPPHLAVGPVTPDIAVYSGVTLKDTWETDIPPMILFRGIVFAVATTRSKLIGVVELIRFRAELGQLIPSDKVQVLPDSEIQFLLGWDAEKYRQAVN